MVLAWLLQSVTLAVALAADGSVSGPWQLAMDPDFKGNPSIENCSIEQRGSEISVCCGGSAMSGEVVGRRISWRFRGRLASLLFGTVS